MKSCFKSYIIKALFITAIFIFIPFQTGISKDILSTIYTVIGIMFSIALSLIVTFNLQGIKSSSSVASMRYKLKVLRRKHILNFIIDTILIVIGTTLVQTNNEIVCFVVKDVNITLNFMLVITALLISSVFYYVLNFINIQKLNDQIFNEVNDLE